MRIPDDYHKLPTLFQKDPTLDQVLEWKAWLENELRLVDQVVYNLKTLPRIMALSTKEPKPKEN